MPIREKRRRCAIAPLLALALGLGGCGFLVDQSDTAVSDNSASDAGAAPDPIEQALSRNADGCLVAIWDVQDQPRREFDRENDQARGGAISCATDSTASQFDDAIAAIRLAAQTGNRADLLREVGVPLIYIDAEGERRELRSGSDVDQAFDMVFDAETIALLSRLDLDQMSVSSGQGGDFALGSVWLAVPRQGARPRLVTVNRQALREAIAAAREEAATAPVVATTS